MDYLYDGSFEGLLTCVYHHYYSEKASGIFPKSSYQGTFLSSYKEVETEEEKADKVYQAVEQKISAAALGRIYNVFLSADQDKETKILTYLILGFKVGGKLSLFHSHPVVYELQQIEKKVRNEVHRLTGLVRFSALQAGPSQEEREGGAEVADKENREVLYCLVEPDHDVIELLADHFADRLKNDPFIIHDKRRGKAVFAYGGSWQMASYQGNSLGQLPQEEKQWQDLWRSYFNTMAIKERINPRCQKNHMPLRYWKNLTEFRGPPAKED